MTGPPPISTPFPYPTLSRSEAAPDSGRPPAPRAPPPARRPPAVTRFPGRLGIELPILQAPMAGVSTPALAAAVSNARSEEHTSELQSRQYLVCRLLLEKKIK